MKRAITHLKLEAANGGKLAALDAVGEVYQAVVQRFVNHLIRQEVREPDKYGEIPGERAEVPGPPAPEWQVSERWRRCAWQQACGIVRSWFSNQRHTPPTLRPEHLCIQGNANVVVLERAATARTFDFWLRVSTLAKGHPVWLPLKLYRRGGVVVKSFPKLCTGVTLNRREGVWYATLVVEKPVQKPPAREVVGIDLGLVSFVTTSHKDHFGGLDERLKQRIERDSRQFQRKQKLNACLRRKGKPEVALDHPKTNATIRNLIGRALNQCLANFPPGATAAIERLNVKDMRMKSRLMNRRLRAAQIGFLRDRLKIKLDEGGIRYKSVQAAYSSQECPECGFTIEHNRPTQANFCCCWCGFSENADYVEYKSLLGLKIKLLNPSPMVATHV